MDGSTKGYDVETDSNVNDVKLVSVEYFVELADDITENELKQIKMGLRGKGFQVVTVKEGEPNKIMFHSKSDSRAFRLATDDNRYIFLY